MILPSQRIPSRRIKTSEEWDEEVAEFGEQHFSDPDPENNNPESGSQTDETELPRTAAECPSKLSLERATPDDKTIAKRTRTEYVTDFKQKLVKTARSTIEMCRVIYEANQSLDHLEFRDFCRDIGYGSNNSTIRKYIAIGKVYPRLLPYADQLPASWTNLYLITQIPSDDFEKLVSDSSLSAATGADLNEMVRDARGIDTVASPLSIDKKSGNFVFGKLMFTKKPDETDWRAMQKALAELEARLPIRFAINQMAQHVWEQRKLTRYEQGKTKYQAIEFKPESWDLGRDANASVPEKGPTPQS